MPSSSERPLKRKHGRLKGSKNKVKPPAPSSTLAHQPFVDEFDEPQYSGKTSQITRSTQEETMNRDLCAFTKQGLASEPPIQDITWLQHRCLALCEAGFARRQLDANLRQSPYAALWHGARYRWDLSKIPGLISGNLSLWRVCITEEFLPTMSSALDSGRCLTWMLQVVSRTGASRACFVNHLLISFLIQSYLSWRKFSRPLSV
ncbi:hypothetical protein CC79DRAFT_1338434 [Sarocladium strictum]